MGMHIESNFTYTIRKYRKAKYMRLSVYPSGRVVLSIPYHVSKKTGISFLEERKEWIREQLETYRSKHKGRIFTRQDYLQHRESARKIILERVKHFNQFYNFSYGKIFIKDQKTLWGSCSINRNLNFNYKLLFLTEEQRDYVVVHELCHLQELNHSRKFWDLVKKAIPDVERIKNELRGTVLVG